MSEVVVGSCVVVFCNGGDQFVEVEGFGYEFPLRGGLQDYPCEAGQL